MSSKQTHQYAPVKKKHFRVYNKQIYVYEFAQILVCNMMHTVIKNFQKYVTKEERKML